MNLKLIKKLCGLDINNLKPVLTKYLHSQGYKHIINNNLYIIAEGDIPICLIAHMDTVFRRPPFEFFYDNQKQVLWSPSGSGFDDRAGIYGIIQIIEAGFRPTIIFTDGEEKGGIGASKIVSTYPDYPFVECKALIQLDRANKEDAVFYECNNPDFEKYICKFGFKLDYGSFSDISILAPAWKIAAVNLSIGYVDEHSESERLYCNWCDATIKKVKKILANINNMPSFTYIPFERKRYNNLLFLNHNNCLICNKPLKIGEGFEIKEDTYSYLVCEDCYKSCFGSTFEVSHLTK